MENDDAESDDDNQHQKIDMLNEDPENESDNKHEIIDMLNIDDDEDESGNLLDDFGKTEDECPMNCMCQRNFNGFLVANCDR